MDNSSVNLLSTKNELILNDRNYAITYSDTPGNYMHAQVTVIDKVLTRYGSTLIFLDDTKIKNSYKEILDISIPPRSKNTL